MTPSNITFILGSQKKRKKEAENLFEEIIVEDFPNVGNETDTQIKEA